MRLVLGGVAQGKRNYVKTAYHISVIDIFSGENAELEQLCGKKKSERAGRCAKTHRNIYKEKPGLYRDLQ